MAENGDSTYNNANRGFLQAFLARSTLTYDQAKPIIAAILTAQGLLLPHHLQKLEADRSTRQARGPSRGRD